MGKKIRRRPGCGIGGAPDRKVMWNNLLYAVDGETIGRARSPDRAGAVRKQKIRAIPHNSKCRYGERGVADAKPKAQIILDAAKVSAASGGNSEPKQGQRSQSVRGFCPRSTMRGTATRHYRAFWQRRCRAAAAEAVLKPQGGNCAVLP